MSLNDRARAISNELRRRELDVLKELSARDFYQYCQLTAPDFYLDSRKYLKEYCQTLQNLYEGKLKTEAGDVCQRLLVQMPPRHGKTRTLTKFSAWILGRDYTTGIIAGAYNDTLAYDFSKFTRDEIREEKLSWKDIVYSDIFPHTTIKRGSSSMKQWAVKGSHFSYRGTGTEGTVTGKGGNVLIIDDPIKDAETAFNELAVEKVWLWYTGTLLSRKEHGAIQIITFTPWPCRDLADRIMSSEMAPLWRVLCFPACRNGEMLCPSILSKDEYTNLKKEMDPLVFAANYDMVRLKKHGMMYESFKTYDDLPVDSQGRELCEEKAMFTDTAGKGEDYLVSVYGNIYKGMFYVFDVEFTQQDIDKTEHSTATRIIDNKITLARIENNSAGHSFAYHVEKILADEFKWFGTQFVEFFTSKNKNARIFSNRIEVMNRIIFPADWRHRWPEFYSAVTTYQKIGKNKHDDGPDVITAAAEYIKNKSRSAQKINHEVI